MDLFLVGIGTGNPNHMTQEAARVLNEADLILIPHKGEDKADLAELRQTICERFVTSPATKIVTFDLPQRDRDSPDYRRGVEDWHCKIARVWGATIAQEGAHAQRVALMVWGDPSLYDSTLRIAKDLDPQPTIHVVPGITSMQMLAAAHGMALADIGAPFMVTTGRQLRDKGWPSCTDTLIVMLDGECSFRHVETQDVTIWWGAYLGMPEEIIMAGAVAEIGPRIVAARAEAQRAHGWIMDIYLLRRQPTGR